mmetsp:Transcript_56739/g.157106  ORF Transcript_56739/g.157106 Transcript_56739/m.157106 type:complete len:225 (+) Transcript_56739:424-1098(+)
MAEIGPSCRKRFGLGKRSCHTETSSCSGAWSHFVACRYSCYRCWRLIRRGRSCSPRYLSILSRWSVAIEFGARCRTAVTSRQAEYCTVIGRRKANVESRSTASEAPWRGRADCAFCHGGSDRASNSSHRDVGDGMEWIGLGRLDSYGYCSADTATKRRITRHARVAIELVCTLLESPKKIATTCCGILASFCWFESVSRLPLRVVVSRAPGERQQSIWYGTGTR